MHFSRVLLLVVVGVIVFFSCNSCALPTVSDSDAAAAADDEIAEQPLSEFGDYAYVSDLAGVPGEEEDASLIAAAQRCPWSKTGKCICGDASGGAWEFTCPSDLAPEAGTSFVGYGGENGEHDDAPAADDGGRSAGANFPLDSGGYVVYSYPLTITFKEGKHVVVKCSLKATAADFEYLKDHNFTEVRSY